MAVGGFGSSESIGILILFSKLSHSFIFSCRRADVRGAAHWLCAHQSHMLVELCNRKIGQYIILTDFIPWLLLSGPCFEEDTAWATTALLLKGVKLLRMVGVGKKS